MVEDIVGGVFKFFGRFLAQIFIEVILELIIKGPGYFLAKLLYTSDPDVDGFAVISLGLVFWLIVGGGCYALFVGFGTNANT